MKYDDIIERLKILIRLTEPCDNHPDCEGCDRIDECHGFTNEMARETYNAAIDAITDLRKTVLKLEDDLGVLDG